LVEQINEKYTSKGYLTKLIDEKKEEFGLPADYYISLLSSIQSHVKRRKPKPVCQMWPIKAFKESLIQLYVSPWEKCASF
jgi:hypothetical protein